MIFKTIDSRFVPSSISDRESNTACGLFENSDNQSFPPERQESQVIKTIEDKNIESTIIHAINGKKNHAFGVALIWVREPDLNRRPPGYEPGELPDCSIPHMGTPVFYLVHVFCQGKGGIFIKTIHDNIS